MPFSNLFTISSRSIVSFFNKYSAEQLWKSVTSVSARGRRSGRHKGRKKIVYLDRGQFIGRGPIVAQFPGLNTPVAPPNYEGKAKHEQRISILHPDKEFKARLVEAQQGNRRLKRKKLQPLERGWSGTREVGRKLGPPLLRDEFDFSGMDSVCLDLRYIANMTARGRTRFGRALMVVGNGKGLGGYGIAVMPNLREAINRARNFAARRMIMYSLNENRTIYQDVCASKIRTRLFIEQASVGEGLDNCHRVVKSICEVLGIKDLRCRIEGSSNYIHICEAFFAALRAQETYEQLAERTGLHVVEFKKENQYVPIVRASPTQRPVRSVSEILPGEVLDVEQMYGEGRLPKKEVKKAPFYLNTKGHIISEFWKYPFRNMEKVKLRLMADEVVLDFNEKSVDAWADAEHKKVISGIKPLPRGIALPRVTNEDWYKEDENDG